MNVRSARSHAELGVWVPIADPPAKAAIADAAAALVEPGSVVAISAGTTAYAVATRLMDVPDLTVITNSLPVAELTTATRKGVPPRLPSGPA